MATYEVTKPNMRLDEVVVSYYGSLDQFAQVKELNPDLGLFLELGDLVQLPTKSATLNEEVLW